MARSIYPHWKSRREKRKGRSIMPILNVRSLPVCITQADSPQFDESNDGDPYVCFRRRDIRATRKTRRTDTFSVERMQKLQYELRAAQNLASLTLRREMEKLSQYKVEKEVWEAKWKLFETKRRWPSLGMSREEEEMITGRAGITGGSMVSRESIGRRQREVEKDRSVVGDRERERERDREKRERMVEVARREMPSNAVYKSMAPESIKERLALLKQKLEEELAKKKEADAGWDDATDVSVRDSGLAAMLMLCSVVVSAFAEINSFTCL
jgi:enhancer of polycomb-like protein